jgi:hypothetical protein
MVRFPASTDVPRMALYDFIKRRMITTYPSGSDQGIFADIKGSVAK